MYPLAVFSWIFLNERLGVQGFIGAALVIFGVYFSAMSVRDSQIALDADNQKKRAAFNGKDLDCNEVLDTITAKELMTADGNDSS